MASDVFMHWSISQVAQSEPPQIATSNQESISFYQNDPFNFVVKSGMPLYLFKPPPSNHPNAQNAALSTLASPLNQGSLPLATVKPTL